MSYRITNCEKYLLIEFIGNTGLEENELARKEIIEILNKEGIGGVLVDMNEADLSDVNLEELVEFGNSWEGLLFVKQTKFATLVPNNNPFREKVDLSLWAGKTKGVQLKIFEERSLAIQWLETKE